MPFALPYYPPHICANHCLAIPFHCMCMLLYNIHIHTMCIQTQQALCYYTHPREKEAKGWMYLEDVAELTDSPKDNQVC